MAYLKKHIQKRYLVEKKANPEQIKDLKEIAQTVSKDKMNQITKMPKDKVVFIGYDSDTLVLACPYRMGNAIRFIPIPDPVLIYFNNAYYNFKQVQIRKNDIIQKIGSINQEDILNELYAFYANATGVIIYLFTTIEAFVNRAIPSIDFLYVKEGPIKTEVYNKSQIERNIKFDEKINKVLAQVYQDKKKPFADSHPLSYTHINNLKKIRNSIIHLQSSAGEENQIAYEEIFKKLIDYKYEEALNAVKDFCNYYHYNPDYISECPCNIPD